MPLTPLIFRPGFNKQATALLNEGGYSDGTLVRFRDALAEKFKGWANVAMGQVFAGCVRALLSWAQISGQKNAALGGDTRLQIFQGGLYYDITPVDTSGSLGANPFTTTNGSAVVSVNHTAHGRSVGDHVIFAGAATFNNVTMNGEFVVLAVTDANNYTVTASTVANASGSGGGASVTFTYLLPVGACDAQPGFGWGAGVWGAGTWGTPRSVSSTVLEPRIWALDLLGEDLIASVRKGKIYTWDASAGVGTRAVVLTNAPTINNWMLVSVPQRHVVSLGAEVSGTHDPMLVRWCDAEDFTDWTATATNAAGSFRLGGGSEIVSGKTATREMLIWTDIALHAMRFTGPPYTFRFDEVGTECGLKAPNAKIVLNGIARWMGNEDFFEYRGGAPVIIQCTVRDEVFGDLNLLQKAKIYAGINPAAHEVIWFYPSAESIENDRYVVYNYEERVWYTGTGMPRTAWNEGGVFGFPLATHASNGKMYYHEFGEDDDGQPMQWFIETGDADLDESDYFMFGDDFFPNFKMENGGSVDISLLLREEPEGDRITVGPKTVLSTDKVISLRGRGRQAALRIGGNTLGMSWRMGKPRWRVARDGKA
jgi:hypothetical protein